MIEEELNQDPLEEEIVEEEGYDSDYFATKSTDDIGKCLYERVEDYYEYCSETGRLALWHRLNRVNNVHYHKGGQILRAGENGEYTIVTVNHFRNILQHMLVKTTRNKPAWEPRAANTDYRSQAQTTLAKGILEYEMRDKHVDRYLKRAVAYGVLYGEGFCGAIWNQQAGEVTEGEMGTERQGDIEYCNFMPIDVIRDVTKVTWDDGTWLITREFKNKYDVAARFGAEDPDFRRHIESIDWDEDNYDTRLNDRRTVRDETDDIPVFTFYHAKTEALPNGRLVMFLADETILLDADLPYEEIPVYRVAPDEQDDFPFGYSIAFDLLPLQEMLDILYSTVATNQKAFGVQSILNPKGSSLDIAKATEGMTIIDYKPTVAGNTVLKPEPLQFTATPAEVFKFIEMIVHDMETVSGVNSVTRGNPESNLKSGAALALVESQAIEFNSGLEQAYISLIEDIGTNIVNILKQYASSTRIITIAGKSRRSLLKEFTGDDLSEINKVNVDAGNALTKTIAGRMNLAEILLDKGFIENPEQLLTVLDTGQLDNMTEGKTAELLQVREENEDLTDGDAPVKAIVTDEHLVHINEHKCVIASSEARMDEELMTRTLQHIQEHIMFLIDPQYSLLLMTLGQQSLAAPQGGPTPNQAGEAAEGAAQLNSPMGPEEPGLPNQPGMPTNPLTGNQYTPETGGM